MAVRLKQLLKDVLERALSVRIYSSRPHGRDDCHDILAAGRQVRTVFDVGANDGSSAEKFASAFRDAVIYSFEPVASTYEALVCNTRRYSIQGRVVPVQLGLGATAASLPIFVHPRHSTMSSFVVADTPAPVTEVVQITTVDLFAGANGIARVDLLKIDTEGFDLEVLRGAQSLLQQRAIQFVLAEVTLDRASARHVQFESVRDFLRPYGFSVYGVYDQQLDWSGRKRLEYTNACFILDEE